MKQITVFENKYGAIHRTEHEALRDEYVRSIREIIESEVFEFGYFGRDTKRAVDCERFIEAKLELIAEALKGYPLPETK